MSKKVLLINCFLSAQRVRILQARNVFRLPAALSEKI